jgi:ankyrin repeat protein
MVKTGDKDAERLLEANPYLTFDIDELKMTPLHWAARAGHAELVNILTKKYRANTLAKDEYDRTPLHLAVVRKNIECAIRIFIEGGKLTSLNNAKESVRNVAPDVYTKYLLEKLEEVRFIVRAKGIKDAKKYRKELEDSIRNGESLYF